MHLIFGLLFRSSFWVQFILAAALVWFGFFVQNDENNRQAARAALLLQAPPATIPISAAHPGSPSRIPVELSIAAQIATDHNTRLIRKTNFIKTGESQLFVLIDPAPGADPNIAEAAIVIDPDDRDAFVQWVVENSTDLAGGHPITTINGLLEYSSHASHAREAMQEQGMVIADDFFFIEPFFKGREASLTAIPGSAAQISWPIFLAAAAMALLGVVRFKNRGRPMAEPIRGVKAGTIKATSVSGPANPLADLQAANTTSAIPAPKKPKLTTGKVILALAVAIVVAVATGQTWVFSFTPLLVVGLMFLALRNGVKSVAKSVEGVVQHFGSKTSANAVPSHAAATVTPTSNRRTAASDGGPIRPGFAFSDLLPVRKMKPTATPDPFDRLSQRIRAERERNPGR